MGDLVWASSNPLASYASSATVANKFAQDGPVMTQRVPRSRIFSTAKTGPGTYREDEIVVMGDPDGYLSRVTSGGGGAKLGACAAANSARSGSAFSKPTYSAYSPSCW